MNADFSPVSAVLGGALIGGAGALLLLGTGQIAGVSGVMGGGFVARRGDIAWRAAFLGGLALAGAVLAQVAPDTVAVTLARPGPVLLVAGILVGVGTQLGSGCTSGHGVCGLSRGSPRSLVSVCVFMAVGMATATLVGWLGRGGP